MHNKHLEWMNTGSDLESDKDALDDFSAWIDRPYTKVSVEMTVREGWESLGEDDPVLH